MGEVTASDLESVRSRLRSRHSITAVLCSFGTRRRLQEALEAEGAYQDDPTEEDPFAPSMDVPGGTTFRAFGHPVFGDIHVQKEDVLYFLNGIGMEALKVLCRYLLWKNAGTGLGEAGWQPTFLQEREGFHHEAVRYIQDKGTVVALPLTGRAEP